MIKWVEPQLVKLVEHPPEGEGWVHEIKIDGYRIAVLIEDGRVRLLTRSGLDWTDRYPSLAKAASRLKVKSAYIDGEMAALNKDGLPSFALTQQAHEKKLPLMFYAFDLLHLDSRDLMKFSLGERKALLKPLVPRKSGFQYHDHSTERAGFFFQAVCGMHLEGMVSKRIDAQYMPGNRGVWVKAKCLKRQEFVITGWTEPEGSRPGFGALLLGYYDGKELKDAGRVGTGFTDKDLVAILKKLKPLEIEETPLFPSRGKKGIRRVEPKLVAEVTFMSWEKGGVLRHSSFVGLRDDKPARKVRREF
ncbi:MULTISPECIES: non-homologous end-joining DNA ligase [unclassified Beijerinckia]|uniref:non-homologous end-joining DNA ligase n=1 Tax=unclassified Beijerinckia TaxID=2638183 RepID=UPI00089729DC|nr:MULTISPECIES: non-homologous end-joining DNA ligase [unclassified Beijerinckia]MDH7796449.1 DNA ligase D-like protein (predicted ligase) [Beijerinckia sp. GAS462]SEC45579.1 bifunctional non-homologous end joining protein LigD [Beijerinckia sp. 28-YEA-48]